MTVSREPVKLHHVLLLEQRDGLRRLIHSHGPQWAWCEANSVELTQEYARLGETPWLAGEVAQATQQLCQGLPSVCLRWSTELLREAGVPLEDGAQTKLWRALAVRPDINQ